MLLLERLAGYPLQSKLAQALRHQKGLAQRIDCSYLSSNRTSPWLIRIDCRKSDMNQVEAVCRQQIADFLRTPPTPSELSDAVVRLEGLQQLANANSSGRVQQLRNIEMFRLSDSYNQGFAGIYRGLKPADVSQCGRQRLKSDRIVWVRLQPTP